MMIKLLLWTLLSMAHYRVPCGRRERAPGIAARTVACRHFSGYTVTRRKVYTMHAVRAIFDGEKVIVPGEVRGLPPGQVIVVFEDATESGEEAQAWTRIQESALTKAWTNDEDAIYDTL